MKNDATFQSRQDFYDTAYAGDRYASVAAGKTHFAAEELTAFIDAYGLAQLRCLEVGCGRGTFQDVVDDYTGSDLSETVADFLHKPFVPANAERLPFADDEFDAAWSITVLEHVPHPERALEEMRRVLRRGGLLFLKPAWHCRRWNCEGIPVRPYGELTLHQKWIKATLGIREWLPLRMALTAPHRLWGAMRASTTSSPLPLRFGQLTPDYDQFWMADSDAACSLDPFDVLVWFRSRGDEVLSHPTWKSTLLSRHESLIVRVKPGRAA